MNEKEFRNLAKKVISKVMDFAEIQEDGQVSLDDDFIDEVDEAGLDYDDLVKLDATIKQLIAELKP